MTHSLTSFLSLLVCCTQNYMLQCRHTADSNLEWLDKTSQSDQAKWTNLYLRSDWSIFRPNVGYHTTNQNLTNEQKLLHHQRKSFEFESRILIEEFQLIELNQGWDQLELLNLLHWKLLLSLFLFISYEKALLALVNNSHSSGLVYRVEIDFFRTHLYRFTTDYADATFWGPWSEHVIAMTYYWPGGSTLESMWAAKMIRFL